MFWHCKDVAKIISFYFQSLTPLVTTLCDLSDFNTTVLLSYEERTTGNKPLVEKQFHQVNLKYIVSTNELKIKTWMMKGLCIFLYYSLRRHISPWRKSQKKNKTPSTTAQIFTFGDSNEDSIF